MRKGMLQRIVGCVLALSASMAAFSACETESGENSSHSTSQPSVNNPYQPNNGGSVTPTPTPDPDSSDNVVADKYEITIACSAEMGEQVVLEKLIAAYEEKNPDVEIVLETFSDNGFEQYMLGVAADLESSANIIWTSDTYHSDWDVYFTDLRPYYESSAETDYSLYYETTLDAASTNGYFKPTKNYTGAFRSDDLDADSDGYEDYANHSEYGLYYAPREFSKPTILCNTYLFGELDDAYETTYKEVNGVTEMPSDYVSTRVRLQEIASGADWDSLDDLTEFTRFLAERIYYIVYNTTDRTLGRKWTNRAVLDLSLEWEPVYTTVMNELGVDLIGDDGGLQLEQYEAQLEALHNAMFPTDNEELSYYTMDSGLEFSTGNLLMTVCSRPVVLGYANMFEAMYGDTCLEALAFPASDVAVTGSGYAISNIWDGKGMTVNGVYKSYTELSWDFIKYIITEEGQEVAGATGLNIPVLKKLYAAEGNGGVTPAWRAVESLGAINHDAWVAGGELRLDTYNVFIARRRATFRATVGDFFAALQEKDYEEGSLTDLIKLTLKEYSLYNPQNNLR